MTSIHVQPTFDLGTRRQKERESAEIASDIARFRAAGGLIQRLDNTGQRIELSRRETNEAAFARRSERKGAGR